MEHNEYRIHRCKIRFLAPVVDRSVQDESPIVGHNLEEKEVIVIAPEGELGRQLLTVHFDKAFRYGCKAMPNGLKYELLSHSEEKIDAVVRYDDAYRARF